MRIVFLLMPGKVKRVIFEQIALFWSSKVKRLRNCSFQVFLLVGAGEYRCCKETPARFDGSIQCIKCITEHEDYAALTNRTVLLLVGPLLRCRNGRSY